MSYAHTYCRRISAITPPRLMRGAPCIGMGGVIILTTMFGEDHSSFRHDVLGKR
jgi:hypothetical protein